MTLSDQRSNFRADMLKSCRNMYQYIPCLTWIKKLYILLPTSNVSILSYWQKGQRSWFNLYMGQKPKIHQIWLKMVSNYSAENKVPKINSCDSIICSNTIATRQDLLNSINVNGTQWVINCFVVLPWQQSIWCSHNYLFLTQCYHIPDK